MQATGGSIEIPADEQIDSSLECCAGGLPLDDGAGRSACGESDSQAGGDRLGRSFVWLNVTQFLGALNDNVFKLMLVYLLVEVSGDAHRAGILSAAFGLFVVPFLLFSHAAGVIADRVSKRSVIVVVKFVEVAIMLAACAGVYAKSPAVLYLMLFLLGCHSALFSPSKFGIIPELVPPAKLSMANGVVEGVTYVAIIIGAFLPSYLLLKVLGGSYLGVVGVCLFFAVVGLAASFGVEKTPAAGSTKRFSVLFFVEIFRTIRECAADRCLLLAMTGAAFFLFIGAFIQQNTLIYGQECLGMGIKESGFLFPVAALGIAAGSLLAGKLSGRNIEFGIVPLGALGLAGCCLVLGLLAGSLPAALVTITLLGISSGLFIVPLNAFIQHRSPVDRRGEVLACTNFLSFSGVALAAALFLLLNGVLSLGARQCFVVAGVLTGVLAVTAVVVLPDFLVRCIALLVVKSFYRVKVAGVENLPLAGGALLVSNHVTWVDALLISSTTARRVRF